MHLFSNQLWLDEIALCLHQAQGYLGISDPNDPRVIEMRGAIQKYFDAG